MIDINHIESVLYNMDDIDDMYVVQLLPQLRNDTLELSDLVTLYKKQRFEAVTDVFIKFLEPEFKDLQNGSEMPARWGLAISPQEAVRF